MHGGRRGIRVIQHNTNDTKTGENMYLGLKPKYMQSGLFFCTDVHNHKDSYQATMNKMGMER